MPPESHTITSVQTSDTAHILIDLLPTMQQEDKNYTSQTRMPAAQKVFNLSCATVLVVLSVCVAYMYWQLCSLQMATQLNAELVQHLATPQMTEYTDSSGRVKRQAAGSLSNPSSHSATGIPTTPSPHSAVPAEGLSGITDAPDDHHQHHRQLQEDINALMEANRPYSAHMVVCGECSRNHTGLLHYLRWMDADIQGDNNRSVPVLHTMNTMSIPIIPDDGLYHVYGQITWHGRPNATRSQLEDTREKNTLFSIVTLPEEHSHDRGRILISALCTQLNLGAQLNVSYRGLNSFPGDFPVDSSFVSGNVYLRAGQLLAVKMGRAENEIDTRGDKTFFGYHQLQKY